MKEGGGSYAFCIETDLHIFHSRERGMNLPAVMHNTAELNTRIHTRAQVHSGLSASYINSYLSLPPPHNQIPIILSRQQPHVAGIEPAPILRLDLVDLVSRSSLVSSQPALIMKCNYWTLAAVAAALPGR